MRKLMKPVMAVVTLGAVAASPAAHAWGDREQGALAGAVVGALIAAQAARAPAVIAAPLPPPVVATPLPAPAAPGYGAYPVAPGYGHYPVAVPAPYPVAPYPVAPYPVAGAPVVVGYGWRPMPPRWAYRQGWVEPGWHHPHHHHHRGW
jgi:hypothetical protein